MLQVARGLSKLRGLLETKEEWSLECDVRCSKLLDDAIAGEFSSSLRNHCGSEMSHSFPVPRWMQRSTGPAFRSCPWTSRSNFTAGDRLQDSSSTPAVLSFSLLSFPVWTTSYQPSSHGGCASPPCPRDLLVRTATIETVAFGPNSCVPARYSLPLGMCLLFPGCEQLSPGGIIASHLPAATMDELAIVVRVGKGWKGEEGSRAGEG
eukprot:753883-Hanusia_phi.AAC.6